MSQSSNISSSLDALVRSIPPDITHEDTIDIALNAYRLGLHDGCNLERQYDAEQSARLRQSSSVSVRFFQ